MGSRAWRGTTGPVLMAFLIAGMLAGLLGPASPAAACSLAPSEFTQAAWVGQNRFAATYGWEVSVFDFDDGLSSTGFLGGYFHRLGGDPSGDLLAVRVQEGLGAMCEGQLYLEFWDLHRMERVDRFLGDYGPLLTSEVALVTGVDGGLEEVMLVPWDSLHERSTVKTGLPEEFHRMSRVGAAVSSDAMSLVAAAEGSSRLFLVPLGPEDPSRSMLSWTIRPQGLEGTPVLAAQPMGSKMAFLFTDGERDRVVLLDTARPQTPLQGVMNATAVDLPGWQGHSMAWTDDGIAVVAGDKIRHVGLDGRLKEVRLGESQAAKQVVASSSGSTWVVLVEDWNAGHQVIRYLDDGVVVEQWVQERGEWVLMKPWDWTHLEVVEQGDPSWQGQGPPQGWTHEDGPYVPAPAGLWVLLMVLGWLFVWRHRRPA
jgi:hypothetical protein